MENIWAAEQTFILEYLQRRENVSESDAKAFMDFFSAQEKPVVGERILSVNGDTATIDISGPLSKDGPDWFDIRYGYGGTGYREIIAAADIVAADDAIQNVKLKMNTPGGITVGLDEAQQAIAELSKLKDVEAINTGMIASAGYYIASAATRITSTSPANETGSIGCVIVGMDWSKMDERMGLKEVVIVSKNAPDKYATVETDAGIGILQNRVDALERVFYQRISEGRGVSSEDIAQNFGRGSVMIAQDPDESMPDAISVGMIDGLTDGVGFSSPATQPPAQPAGLQTEGESMSLADLMASDPGIKAEVELMVRGAKETGCAEGKASVEARIDKAKAFMGETSYPKAIQALATKVLTGESEPAALEGAVAMFDAQAEIAAAKAAEGETKKTGDTPADQPKTTNEDGTVTGEADANASIQAARERRGLKG